MPKLGVLAALLNKSLTSQNQPPRARPLVLAAAGDEQGLLLAPERLPWQSVLVAQKKSGRRLKQMMMDGREMRTNRLMRGMLPTGGVCRL